MTQTCTAYAGYRNGNFSNALETEPGRLLVQVEFLYEVI
jgi:hypothetical protein